MKALVLSGGGLFGAWQAGAWQAVSSRFQPGIVVGASVGALNGYWIASGLPAAELCDLWRQPDLGDFKQLHPNIRRMMDTRKPMQPFAVVVTDLVRLKPKIFQSPDLTWEHLAASCALPGVLPQ